MTYADKLKDPRWQKRRVEVMQRDGFKCRQCGAADKTLAIHHLAYGRGEEPWESPAEVLLTVCEGCHDRWRAFADWCSRLQVIVRDAEMEPEAAQQIIAGALQNDGSRKMNPACLGEMLSTPFQEFLLQGES